MVEHVMPSPDFSGSPFIKSWIVQQLGYLTLNQKITVQLRVRVPFSKQ